MLRYLAATTKATQKPSQQHSLITHTRYVCSVPTNVSTLNRYVHRYIVQSKDDDDDDLRYNYFNETVCCDN